MADVEGTPSQRKLVAQFCTCRARDTLRYGGYRVPSESGCDVEFERYHLDDLDELDEIAVEAELAAIVRRLAFLPRGAHPIARDWLLRRRAALLEAQQARAIPEPSEAPVPATSEGVPQVRVVVVEVE